MGNVIEFYRPANFKHTPRPVKQAKPAVKEGISTDTSAVELLRQVTVQCELVGLKDVLIVTQDNDGTTGLLTTFDGQPEVLLLLEQVKAKMIQNSMGETEPPTGNRIA